MSFSVTSQGQGDFEDAIQLRFLRWEGYSKLSFGPILIYFHPDTGSQMCQN